MEGIKDAIERAKRERGSLPLKARQELPNGNGSVPVAPPDALKQPRGPVREKTDHGLSLEPAPAEVQGLVALDPARMEKSRIFAYKSTDRNSVHYDMLRTQVLQTCEAREIRTLAVTAPHAGAGKTVTSINLAFSIARMSEQRVLLVDLDLRKASIARYLGLHPNFGINDILADTCRPSQAVVRPDLGEGRLSVLVAANPVPLSTEQISGPQMKKFTSALKASTEYSVVIFDLPPMLASDDFLAFLPQVDGALLVTESNKNSVQQVSECLRLIGKDKFLGCVLNKTSADQTGYGYYGR